MEDSMDLKHNLDERFCNDELTGSDKLISQNKFMTMASHA